MQMQLEVNEDTLVFRGHRIWLREVRKTVRMMLGVYGEHGQIYMDKTKEGYELRISARNAPRTRDALIEMINDFFGYLANELGGTEVITPLNTGSVHVN